MSMKTAGDQKMIALFNSIKEGKTDLDSLTYDELHQFNLMMDEEIRLKVQKLKNLKKKNQELIVEIEQKKAELNKLRDEYIARFGTNPPDDLF